MHFLHALVSSHLDPDINPLAYCFFPSPQKHTQVYVCLPVNERLPLKPPVFIVVKVANVTGWWGEVMYNYRRRQSKRRGYEVPGMILLQASYLYTYSLLRGVTFEVLPFSSYALSPTMLPLLETFWNSCCRIAFSATITFTFHVFAILKSSSLYDRLYFWKQSIVVGSQIRGNEWVLNFSNWFLGQKLLERERLVSWNIIMVENPNVGPKFGHFSRHSFR
jgi:hypothetical protein